MLTSGVLLMVLQEPLESLMPTKASYTLSEVPNMPTYDFKFKNNKRFQANRQNASPRAQILPIRKPTSNSFRIITVSYSKTITSNLIDKTM